MVSVVVPVYNVEKYLRECLDSIINQTYNELEIILVDDGSVDKSGSICDEYALNDNRIIVIHQSNKGQSGARNTGLDKATGDYIYFMDSDDILDKEAIRLSVELAEKEKADIVCFNAETKYEDFNDSSYREVLNRKIRYPSDTGAKILKMHLENAAFFSCVYMHLFRAKLIKTNEIRFCKLPMCEDELFTTITYIRAGRIADLGMTLYTRRLRADSVMSQKDTVAHVNSLVTCIDGFINELERYPAKSSEREAMLLCIDEHARVITRVFSELDKDNRKLAIPEMKKLLKIIDKLNYQGNWNVMLRLRFPYTFAVFRNLYEWSKKYIRK